MIDLATYLRGSGAPQGLSDILLSIGGTSLDVRRMLPFCAGVTASVNPSGEKQTEVDIYANDSFASAVLATGRVAEVASEEMATPTVGQGSIHVSMDPLDGSSNISTNNPLGSIFGLYSSRLPCSGEGMIGAAFVTYGPMLTLTFSLGAGVQSFVAVEDDTAGGGTKFVLLHENVRMPENAEVFGLGGQRKDWIAPVERFVSTLEARGLKLRYGGAFVGDYNQVLRYGGIFGYPALKTKPAGKLRVLYEAAPMAYITRQAGGYASDGTGDLLLVRPPTLAATTPVYLGSREIVKEVESMVRGSAPAAPTTAGGTEADKPRQASGPEP